MLVTIDICMTYLIISLSFQGMDVTSLKLIYNFHDSGKPVIHDDV